MLAAELAHQRSLAEVEVRLRGDLVDDLLAGADEDSIYARAEAVGHDLHRPHRVVAVERRGGSAGDDLVRAVERAAAAMEMSVLLARRSGRVILLAQRPAGWKESHGWEPLHQAVSREFGSADVALGVGGRALRPGELPRSYVEATRALAIRQGPLSPDGITAFEDLGIYRILAAAESRTELEDFVRQWLGALIDYDVAHGAQLVKTLSQYLEHGGSYAETAQALVIHRSTLRYRLQRIGDVSGLELNNVETRFNLHVATRARKVLDGRAV